ncbi:MAG: polysaccharide biosynthesis tyrosine autokinase [Candidatus Korobacteraceae bacterium]
MILPANSELRQHQPSEIRSYYHSDPPVRDEELVLLELWRTLRTRWSVMVGCAAACLLLATLYVLIRSPRYEASARIEVSPAGTNAMGLDELSSRILSPSDPTIQLQSAVTVLQSNTVALAVMQQTKLAERTDFAGRWIQPPGTDVSALSPEVRDKLLLRFQKNLKVEIVPKTDIIAVAFRTKDPRLSAEVVNSIVSSYAERNFRSSYDSATQVSNWLSAQMEDLKLRANDAQEKLAALQKRRGLIGVDETDNIVTDKLKDLNEQLTAAESDRIVKEARYRIAGSGNPELIASTVPEPTLQVLRSQQAQLRVDYARLSTKFGDGYPKLAELGSQMAQVDSAINSELKNLGQRYKNEYLAAASTEKALQGKFEEQKQKAYDLNQGAAQYAILKHEVETTQDLYQTLQLKLKQAGIVAGLAAANIGVVETGQIPSEPADPRPFLDIALGLGSGLVLGVLTAVGLERLDTTIRTAEEAEAISALPTLAEIPSIAPDRPGRRRWKSSAFAITPAERLIAHRLPHSPAAESYRCLRTSLLLGSPDRPPRTLTITSCLPGEGKTLTAVNCAVVLAQQGAKVLLVDADLRQPAVHKSFALSQDPGLSGILTGLCTKEEATALSDLLPNLSVLPAGASCPYPAETLASPGMAELLDYWGSRYDHIIFDTPPASMFTDAVMLSSQTDAVVLVARCGVTTQYALRHLRDLLQRSNARLAGVVLNGVNQRNQPTYYRRHGYGLTGRRPGPADN